MDTELLFAIRNRILELCGEQNFTINEIANKADIPPSTVKNIIYCKSKKPKMSTIKKICDGFDITLGEFFSTPEFDALEQEIQ
ncbi:MAG: helix-turn-helix domain-containing protein [Candidatus Fimenecus sp.]